MGQITFREQTFVKTTLILTLRNGQCRRPLIFQDIQTDASIAIDVRMINFGSEVNLI